MKTRTWILLGACAAGAVAFSQWAEHRDGKRVRPVAAEVDVGDAPPTARTEPPPSDPERPSLEAVTAALGGREPRERHDAPVVNGVVQIGPVARGKGAPDATPAEHVTSASWATSYAVAMCDCHTRACAADLQGGFIRAMGGVDYDEARDGSSYHDAMKRAVDCYLALPEGS